MTEISSGRPGDSPLRQIPQVDRLARSLDPNAPHALRTAAARLAVSEAKRELMEGRTLTQDEMAGMAEARLKAIQRSLLKPVINATGVILHTNLGRAPIAASAIEAVARIGSGYSNLEFDLNSGRRGSRYDHAAEALRLLTGAGSCLVVNNNAAAILLVLSTFARGKEVIVSRGELVEIGGEFRVPDVMAASGAILKEVGTTNRTHLKDYQEGIGPNTAAIMKVHPSNYKVIGYTASVAPRELSALARQSGVLFLHDIGSGLPDVDSQELPGETTIEQALAQGADLVTFSGDKLLGGPQAGIIAGREDLVGAMKKSPLLRALRVDKMTLAALEGTLMLYLSGHTPEIPVWRMAALTPVEIEQRAAAVVDGSGDLDAKVQLVDGASASGGGSSPQSALPTVLIEVSPRNIAPEQLTQELLAYDPPVVVRIENDAILLDLRTVEPHQDVLISEALRHVL